MKLKYLIGVLFGVVISTSPFKTFQMANATNQLVVAIKQDNFSGTATQLDTIFRRSGTTVYSSNAVSLVQNQEGAAGGFFSRNRIFMNNSVTSGFSAYFEILQNGGHNKYEGIPGFGDGFTFIISRDFNVLGASGGAIGYGGINNSVAILFDTFDNGGQPPMCLSLGINGSQGACSQVGGYNGVYWRIWVDYSRVSETMELRMNSSNSTRPVNATRQYTGLDFDNVGDEFFAGFTSSTGGAVQNTLIYKWYLTGYFVSTGIVPSQSGNFVQDTTATLTPVIEPVYLEDRKRWSFRPDAARTSNLVSFHAYAFNGENNRSVYFDNDFPELPETNRLVINLYAISVGGVLSLRADYPFHKAFYNLNYPNAPMVEGDFIEYRQDYPVTANQSLMTPTRPGYTFKGWGTSSTQTRNLKSSHSFLRDTLFFAQWTLSPFAVTFETNGGSSINPITTDIESGISLPQAPTKDFAAFVGWFTDEALTIPYNQNSINGNAMTLYAKWAPVQYSVNIQCDVTSNQTLTMGHGDTFTLQDKTNTLNQIFQGYFTDAALTNPYLGGPVTSNMTIHSKWLDITPANTVTQGINEFDLATLTTDDQEALAALNQLFSALDAEQIPYISEDNQAKLIALTQKMNDMLIVEQLMFDIDSLERIATLEMEEDIESAIADFENLTPAQLALLPLDRQHHLLDLKDQLIRLINAEDVADMIVSLPSILSVDDLPLVEDVLTSYLALSDMEKELVDPQLRIALTMATNQHPLLQTVKEFVDLIDALDFPLTLDQLNDVQHILAEWSQLTPEQKALIPATYQDLVLSTSTTMIHLFETDDFESMMDLVTVDVTEENQANYEAIIAEYEGLHDDQRALLSEETLNKIRAIIDKLNALHNEVVEEPEDPVDPEDPEEPEEPPIDPRGSFPWIIVFVSLSVLAGSFLIKIKK